MLDSIYMNYINFSPICNDIIQFVPIWESFWSPNQWWGATVLFYMLLTFQLSILVCFYVQSLIYTPIYLLFTLNSVSTVYHCVLLRARCKNEGGGVVWVAQNCSRLCAQNYAGARFNVTIRGPMLGPSPDLGPAGEWGVNICEPFMSTISRPQLRSVP